jgi:hypothetical protein
MDREHETFVTREVATGFALSYAAFNKMVKNLNKEDI